MMRLAAFVLAVCASGLGDSLHLRVVLNASSPAEYNRWVWQHRTECPGFRHVYITCDSMRQRGRYVWPAVSFWSDSGPLLTHRIIPDSQPEGRSRGQLLDISRNTDQMTVASASGRGTFAMYDRFGTRLFTDPSRPQGLTSGRWIRFTFHPPGKELLDDSGKVLSRISSSDAGVLYSSDSLCALSADGSVVFIGRDGRGLWRSRKINAHCAVAVGSNGSAVAAATGDSLMIWKPPSTKTVVLPHDKAWNRFGRPTMAWSPDGRRLAVYQGSQTAWDSGRVFVMNMEGRLVRPIRRMQLYCVRALVWMGDTLVFPALGEDVSKRTYSSADSCVISFVPPRGGIRRGVVHGKFRLHGEWNASGRHLAFVSPPAQFLVAEFVR